MSRSTVGSGSWFACSRRRSFVSSVTGSDSGTWPMCWTSSSCAQVLEQVVDDTPEILSLLRELLEEEERAGRVAVDDHVAEPQQRLLVDRADELEDGLRVDRVVRRGGELVERRDRVAKRAARRSAR